MREQARCIVRKQNCKKKKKKKKKIKNKRRERTGSTVESMMKLSQETSEYTQKINREEVLLYVW